MPRGTGGALPRRRTALPPAVLAGGVLAAVTLGAAGVGLSAARQREILARALDSYDRAVALQRSDAPRARELLRQAAADFGALREAGVDSAALHYNLGNVCLRLGDLGRAIVHYRRAQRLAPRDADIRANLELARARVQPAIPISGQRRLLHEVLYLHHRLSLAERFGIMTLAAVVGWGALTAWLYQRRRPLAVLGWLGVGASLLGAASIGWQLRAEARTPPAVLVQSQTLRAGRGEAYEPVLRDPLGPGVELEVLGQRGDWCEVRLVNGQRGWLPARALERI